MPAYSDQFPWQSYYGDFRFFEDRMKLHSDVVSLEHGGTGIYELVRKNGTRLRVFICECYAFGVAQYVEAVEHLGGLDAVIINSAWCGYSPDAKRYCQDQKVGLFKIGDFMAALNRSDFWNHLNADEIEFFKEKGWK